MQKRSFLAYHYKTSEIDDKLLVIALLTVTHSGTNLSAEKQVK